MKKWTGVFLAILVMAIVTAIPAGALSLVPAKDYDEKYHYYYIDYNQDGTMELATFGGEPGGYSDPGNRPEWKIHALVDGEVRTFAPTLAGQRLDGLPSGYSSEGELKWFFYDYKQYSLKNVNHDSDLMQSSWGRIHEATFDFENYIYQTIELDEENNDWIARETWRDTWQAGDYESEDFDGQGILTEEIVLQLLLEPPAEPAAIPQPPPKTGQISFLIALPILIAAMAGAGLLLTLKRRTRHAP